MSNLKVSKISINNVLGVEDMEITPSGNVVQIKAKNGSGKTSILEAIKSSLGISGYSKLLRDGADKGSVVLDLGDMQVQKNYKQNGETLSMKGKVAGTDQYTKLSSPAKLLKTLFNPNSVNPLKLLEAKPKELLDAVLSALPMTADQDTLKDITGLYWDVDDHALVVIDKAHKELFQERTGVNRDLKTASTTKEQLEATLPEVIPTTEEIDEEIQENLELIEKVNTAARSASRKVRQEYSDKIKSVEEEVEEIDQDIEELMKQIDQLKDDKSEKLSVRSALISERDSKADAAMEAELEKVDQYQERQHELHEQLSQLNVYSTTQRQVKEWADKVKENQRESDRLTKALEGLQSYKEDLCKDLPIDGLEIKDGLLYHEGVPFETLNTAKRIQIAIEIAKLSAGDLGLVLIDNSEQLDSDTYKQFIKEASKTDLQFIVSRVDDCDLTVE